MAQTTLAMRSTGMLQIMFLVSLESSRQGGVHGLGSMTFGLVVQKFLNIEIFKGIGMCPLVLLERS
jgi:hypothetical protein